MDWLDKIIKDAEPGERAPHRAFQLPRLGPYLWDAHIARTLCAACWAGSRRIVVLTVQWCRAAAPGDRLLRASVPAGAVFGAGWVVSQQRVAGLGLAALWLMVALYLAGSEPWHAAPPVTAAAEEPEAPPALDPLDADTVAALVRKIAAAGGWKGVQLDDLLAHLPGRSRAELLDVLAEAEIPVAEQLKITLPGGRQRNRQGVRLSSLPAGLGEAPEGAASTPAEQPAEGPSEPAPQPSKMTVHGGG